MIVIYRRLNDDNNFINFPAFGESNMPITSSKKPLNDSFSHRFSFLYAHDNRIPSTSIVRENEYYDEPFFEIEV